MWARRMRELIRALLAAAVGLSLAGPALAAGDEDHWGYAGEDGPDHWAKLSKDYRACRGGQQSPVDLIATHRADNEDIKLRWAPFAPEVVNNGHTIQANAPKGNRTVFGGRSYILLQVHFHHRSEHTITGQHQPMEAHFVYRGAGGALLVLGVMLTEGEPKAEIAKIWAAMPTTEGEAQAAAKVDLARLVPADAASYRYAGSLTTPPCSEIVDWVVFADPIEVSTDQIATFTALYPTNNRPVQERNRRFILLGE